MFHTILDLLHRRHFWRHVRFSELSELYMSLTLRTLGLSVVSIFVPLYLYFKGFGLDDIALLFAIVYAIRLLFDPLTGWLISRFGPKSILRWSYLMEIVFLMMVISVGHPWINLWSLSLVFALTTAIFWIPFHVDFSAIRSARRVGHQLSVISILERTAGVLGPLAGGIIAVTFGFEYAVLVAVLITAAASIPLMIKVQTASHDKIAYRPALGAYVQAVRQAGAYIGRSADLTASTLLWPLFVGAILLSRSDAYAGVGLITAIGTAAALLSAYFFGKVVDNKRGRQLLRSGATVSAVIHIIRSFVFGLPAAAALSAVGDPASAAVGMPFDKGWYDRIDSSRYGRIGFTVAAMSVLHLTRVALWGMLYLLLQYVTPLVAFQLLFLICAILTLLTMTERFKALDG